MSDTILLPRPIYLEEFLPLKGHRFVVHCDPKAAHLDLVDIRQRPSVPGAQRQAFTLVFRSAPDVLLVPGLYQMRTDGFGPDVIYIEQTGRPADAGVDTGRYYQAVFN